MRSAADAAKSECHSFFSPRIRRIAVVRKRTDRTDRLIFFFSDCPAFHRLILVHFLVRPLTRLKEGTSERKKENERKKMLTAPHFLSSHWSTGREEEEGRMGEIVVSFSISAPSVPSSDARRLVSRMPITCSIPSPSPFHSPFLSFSPPVRRQLPFHPLSYLDCRHSSG